MKNHSMTLKPVVIALVTLFVLMSTSVYADRDNKGHHDRDRDARREAPPKGYRLDNRYHENRYYRQGHIVDTLPHRRYSVHFHNKNYYYFGGVWYGPAGSRFVVVAPPLGIVVPFLPPFYTTIWLGGIPYYYANDAYYVWRPDLNGYEVTNPPAEVTSGQEPPLTADQLFIYPEKGQSEQQQADDRYECYRWSVDQTGYDPTQPPENLPQNTLNAKRNDYQRAMKTCLEGRGYSVR